MNLSLDKYAQYALCREMLDTVDIIRQIQAYNSIPVANMIKKSKGLFITGEGSSRIIPAKHLMYRNLVNGAPLNIYSDGATQAMDYQLDDFAVAGISNSGKTKELIRLFTTLKEKNHGASFGITANSNTLLERFSDETLQLKCGKEHAVAATKSVVEQALVLERIYNSVLKKVNLHYPDLADLFGRVLSAEHDPEIIRSLAESDVIYFVGRNDGIAEELALKTNEIARKKSAYLEGTYCVHGVEEVMNRNESVVLVDPFESELDKFHDVLVEGVGINVIAIAPEHTPFTTIQVPKLADYQSYLSLAAGWNLLVEIGISTNIDLDKPERARKIGNEFLE